MRTLIETVVKAVADRPEAVRINEIAGAHAHVLELRVAKEDLGKVIGKGGMTANPIRTIITAAGARRRSAISWRSSKTDRHIAFERCDPRPSTANP